MPQSSSDIATFWNDFYTHMEALRGTYGEESPLAIAEVVEGEAVPEQYIVPYVAMQLLDFAVENRTGDTKVWTGQVKIRIVTQTTGALRPTIEIMDKIAQVQDRLDTFARPAGSSGLEDNAWSITYNLSANLGNLIIADQIAKFSVNVVRGDN